MFDFLELKPILTAMLIMGFAEGFSGSVTSACLLGITVNEAFSIVVCVLLGLFAFVFGYVAYRSSDDRFMRICAIIGTVLMPIAAVSAILVDDNVISEQHEAVKIPFYMILAIGILVNFTINIIMIVHSFKWFSIKDRLLTNNNQVIYLFLVNLGMGVVLGLVYGLLPVDSRNDAPTDKMVIVTVVFFFIGFIAGAIFAFFNERETQKMQRIGLDPTASLGAHDYDKI